MFRYAALILSLAFGTVFQSSCGTQVNVTLDDKLCLYANLKLSFSVSYEVADNKIQTAAFELPENVTPDGSSCEASNSKLKLSFGDGHSLSMDFTTSGELYQADSITFSYNLKDLTIFADSVSNDTVTVTAKPQIKDVPMDTCYSCNSKDLIQAESVNMTLSSVLIQAFVGNGSKSEIETSCEADKVTTTPPSAPTTTPPTPVPPTTLPPTPVPPTTLPPTPLPPTTLPPTPLPPTTIPPSTNTTTAEPVTNTTTTAPPTTTPTTTPTPTLPTPTTGNYFVNRTNETTACLLANFGLRIGFKQGEKYEELNLDPKTTNASGSCGVNSSELVLVSGSMTVVLTFTNDTKKFRLHALNITAKTSSGVAFSAANTNLSLWEASVGSSYMCNKEQNFTITSALNLFTFELKVQPFGVKKGVFSTAEECFVDSDLSFLVPIAVGVALSFLIILVLISYLIGRRKSRTGYQSV